MATIEVDLGLFLASIIISGFALPFIIGFVFWRGYKSPEFWLKLKREDWVYALVLNGVGKLVTVVVPLKHITESGAFTMFKNRKYFWPLANNTEGKPGGREMDQKTGQPLESKPEDEKKGQLIFPYKKKTAAFYRYSDPFAQLWAPGNTIFSITDPGMVDDIEENRALQMMMNADSITRLMQFALVISIIGLIAIGGLAFGFYTQSQATNHLSCILLAGNNDTLARACH